MALVVQAAGGGLASASDDSSSTQTVQKIVSHSTNSNLCPLSSHISFMFTRAQTLCLLVSYSNSVRTSILLAYDESGLTDVTISGTIHLRTLDDRISRSLLHTATLTLFHTKRLRQLSHYVGQESRWHFDSETKVSNRRTCV